MSVEPELNNESINENDEGEIIEENVEEVDETQRFMNFIELRLNCLEDGLEETTAVFQAEEDLNELKSIQTKLDEFLESHQTQSLFSYRLAFARQSRRIKNKLLPIASAKRTQLSSNSTPALAPM